MLKKYIILASYSLLLLSACFRQDGQSVKQVMNRYCELDYLGARSGSEFKELLPEYFSLVTWDLEPGWDQLAIISSYKVNNPWRIGRDAAIEVVYNVVGRVIGREYTPVASTQEKNRYLLEKDATSWKVKSGRIVPHISIHTFELHLRYLINTQSSKEYISNLQVILDKLLNEDRVQ